MIAKGEPFGGRAQPWEDTMSATKGAKSAARGEMSEMPDGKLKGKEYFANWPGCMSNWLSCSNG